MIPQAHTIPSGHHEQLPCDDPRQSDSLTQTSILTGHEPKIIETEAGSIASGPKDIEPKRIELDRNLGIDPYQIQENIWGKITQNPITEDVEGFGTIFSEKSWIQSQMHFRLRLSRESEEPVNLIKSSIFKNADPSNLGRSLLEGNKDHLLSQARSNLVKQELQVESLNNCISVLQQQAYAQRLELQDAQHGYVESRREQVRLQEKLSMKEKVLRDTQIRSMHEMEEVTRVQELQVDEVSVQKRENHETTQKLTSQLQEMKDQMNSWNDS